MLNEVLEICTADVKTNKRKKIKIKDQVALFYKSL